MAVTLPATAVTWKAEPCGRITVWHSRTTIPLRPFSPGTRRRATTLPSGTMPAGPAGPEAEAPVPEAPAEEEAAGAADPAGGLTGAASTVPDVALPGGVGASWPGR